MDIKQLQARARFVLGELVLCQGDQCYAVVGRYYRHSTGQILYDVRSSELIKGQATIYLEGVPEGELCSYWKRTG